MEKYEAMLEAMKRLEAHTLMGTLRIAFTGFDGTHLRAQMHVTPRVRQPMGLLHGGATVALGETLSSALSTLFVDGDQYRVMSMEIAANHLHPVRTGCVFG